MKLPDNVKVTIGGKTYKGDIPDDICPEFLKPVVTKPGKKPTADDAAVAYPAAL